MACLETHNNGHLLKLLKRKMSDPDIHHPPPETHSPPVTLRSAAITIPHKTDDDNSESNEDKIGKHPAIYDNFGVIKTIILII